LGQVVDWEWNTMNVSDQIFHPLIERLADLSIVLADWGFGRQLGEPANCKLCKKGTWNVRMRVGTALSMVTVVCDLKWLYHRVARYLHAWLASFVAMFNVVLALFHQVHPDADPFANQYCRVLSLTRTSGYIQ
jgi:hypothetical protein